MFEQEVQRRNIQPHFPPTSLWFANAHRAPKTLEATHSKIVFPIGLVENMLCSGLLPARSKLNDEPREFFHDMAIEMEPRRREAELKCELRLAAVFDELDAATEWSRSGCVVVADGAMKMGCGAASSMSTSMAQKVKRLVSKKVREVCFTERRKCPRMALNRVL